MEYMSVGSIEILDWTEDITLKNAEQFRQAMNGLREKESPNLILNMEKVSYVNSVALGIIADSVMKVRRDKKELIISGVQRPVEEIFRIVKFHSFIQWFPNKDEAIRYYDNYSE